MDARTFAEARKCFDYIDGLYNMLVKIDELSDITSVKLVDSKNMSLDISANGVTTTYFHTMLRNHIKEELRKAKELMESLVPSKASVINAIETAFKTKTERNWDRTYWFFDLHGTLLKPTYNGGTICREFYPYAKEVMQVLSQREDIITVMYTCSHPNEIEEYKQFFIDEGIKFDYINENPEVENSKYGYFEKKPYMNVLFEDKAGFNPETDWIMVHLWMVENKMWPDNILLSKPTDGSNTRD